MPNLKIHKGLAGHDVATNAVLSMIATSGLADRSSTIDMEAFGEVGIDPATVLEVLRDNSDVITIIREDEHPKNFSVKDLQSIRITGVRFSVELLLNAQKDLPFSEEQDGPNREAVRGLAHYRARWDQTEGGKYKMSVTRFTRDASSSKEQPFFTRIREIWVDVLTDNPERAWADLTATCFTGNIEQPVENGFYFGGEVLEYLPRSEDTKYALIWNDAHDEVQALEKVDDKWILRESLGEDRHDVPYAEWERFLDDLWLVVAEVTDDEPAADVAVPVEATEADESDNWPDGEHFVEDVNAWPEMEVRFELTVAGTNYSIEAARATDFDELRATFFDADGKPKTMIAKFRNIRAASGEQLEAVAAEWLEQGVTA